jgi:two-component system response regulator (stage 0 sporulation protein A)
MKTKTIILLELNKAVSTQLRSAFAESNEFDLIYEGDDGDVGIEEILRLKPDLIITSMFLKGTDGCGVIRAIKKNWPQAKIIATGGANDSLIERAMEEGAAYYLVKPFSVQAALDRIRDQIATKPILEKESSIAKRAAITLDEKISKIFISVGIPPHIKGYSYLREGIKLAVNTPDVINNITKKLYPMIGEKYSTSPSKVERAIRHAIEVAWSRGRIGNINELFGVQTYLTGEKPTNGEFIALIADKMLLEGA